MYDFNGDELSIILISLISRRNHVRELLKNTTLTELHDAWLRELETLDVIQDRLFPGSTKITSAT